MSRAFVLLLLATAACGGTSSSLPATPITVSSTPMAPGAVLSLSVTLQQPATDTLQVQFYGSATGPGGEPCVKGGAVCGGLADPIDLGTARFFPEMTVTGVDAAMPKGPATGSTFLLQAIVSSDDGAVASEVASFPVGEAVVKTVTKRPEPTPVPAAQGEAPSAEAPPEREAVATAESCLQEPDAAAIAACHAGRTGKISFCLGLENLDDELFCMGMARKAPDACSQILDGPLRVRCYVKLGITPP